MNRLLSYFWNLWAPAGAPPSPVILCSLATGVLHDEFIQTNDSEVLALGQAQDGVAQSWQSGAAPRAVLGVCFRLKKLGTPTGSMVARIYAHTGVYGTSSNVTGAALVSSAPFDVSTVGASAADFFFPLSGWTPDPTTNYMVAIEDAGIVGGDASNNIKVTVESGAEATHGGNLAEDSGSGYAVFASGAFDMAFKVYYALPFSGGISRRARLFYD